MQDPNRKSEKPVKAGYVRSILRSLFWVFVLASSLIVFPASLPFCVLGWLGLHLFFLRKQWSAWVPLVILLIVLAVKFPELNFGLGFLVATILMVTGMEVVRVSSLRKWIAVLSMWLAFSFWSVAFWWGSNASQTKTCELDRPVVCLGDSLTDFGYPQELERRIRVPVVDLGFSGYTTDDAIKLLPQIVDSKPQAVVIEIGGHDYKDGKPRGDTEVNLRRLIDECLKINAAVILVEIPRGFISDPYFGLERQLAREYDLQLIPDTMIRRLIFWSPLFPPGSWVKPEWHNSEDALHPNSNGNKMMAGYVEAALKRVLGNEVARSSSK